MLHTPDVTWSSLEGDTIKHPVISCTAITPSATILFLLIPKKLIIKYQSIHLVVYLRMILTSLRGVDLGGRVTEASEKTVNGSLAVAMSTHGTVSPVDKNVINV